MVFLYFLLIEIIQIIKIIRKLSINVIFKTELVTNPMFVLESTLFDDDFHEHDLKNYFAFRLVLSFIYKSVRVISYTDIF